LLPKTTWIYEAVFCGIGTSPVILAAPATAAVSLVVIVPCDDELVDAESAAPRLVAHGRLL
jgi:hypothetical protein